jgi:hypothetical protein
MDLARISGAIRNRAGLRGFRWSIRRVDGVTIAVRKTGMLHEPAAKANESPPPRSAPSNSGNQTSTVKVLGSLRDELAQRRDEIQRDIDAIGVTIALMTELRKGATT